MPSPALAYFGLSWLSAVGVVVGWTWRRLGHRRPEVLRSHRTESKDLFNGAGSTVEVSGDHVHHYLARLPCNEILKLDLTERALDVPGLPAALDGLSIIHLSDFHFTGRVGKAFFHEVARLVNAQSPDMIAITGDLVDHDAYIDWIPGTLGRFKSAYGVYFVLGNHDLRVDTARLRRTLVDAGLIDLGGRWLEVRIDGHPVVLAGNELPWIPPAADMHGVPRESAEGHVPWILLSHSPDQIGWAQAHRFDLMLAGHTHGGQICLPLIGPIVTPSRLGVKYASGTFHNPPTILHVTRGISGQLPIRLNCPPELAKLVLHSN